MYTASQIVVSDRKNQIYAYCDSLTEKTYRLYNASLFRIRQRFTGYDKPVRTENEETVFKEIELLEKTYPSVKVKRVISYMHLEKLMRVTENPDFFAGLPMQSAQTVVKSAVNDFNNWLKALKDYKKHPEKYLGKPRMSHYKKTACTLTITNQDAVIYGNELKLPCTKEHLIVADAPEGGRLKEVKVIPYYGRFIISLTFECERLPELSGGHHVAGIDFGVNNIAALVSSDGGSRLYKGGAILSENAFYSKRKARATSLITHGHKHMHADSRFLRELGYHHANFTKDQLHKISRNIITYCTEHNVSVLVLGDNKLWKQKSHMNDANNQNFVQMPISKLRDYIQYKALNAGILVVLQEESYTSKASFIDGDHIPVYGRDDDPAAFSGRRIKRGLYRTADGTVINADLNGAANIIRKAYPYVWNNRACMSVFGDFNFLKSPEVLGFHELNPQGIPAKRIMAA